MGTPPMAAGGGADGLVETPGEGDGSIDASADEGATATEAPGLADGQALELDENGPNRTEAPSAIRTSPTTIATGACLTVRDCDTTTLPALDREGPARPLSAHRA